MVSTKSRILFIISLLTAIYILAWIIQGQALLNRDISWLLHITERLVAGGSYIQDFFEVDPPAILYIYSPVIIFSKYCSLPIILLFKLYIFFLASFSLLINYLLLQKLFSQDDFVQKYFLISIAIVFLIFPVDEFGQKEHLLVMFSMPYIILLMLSIENLRNQLSTFTIIIIGMMAGLGFCIKPYYFFIPTILELYYLYASKKILSWVRPEIGVIIFILVTYCFILLTFHVNYLAIELPLLINYFYRSVGSPALDLLFNSITLYSYLSLLFFIIQYHFSKNKNISIILLLAMAGFFISYILQRTLWYYHLLPLFSFSFLLFALLVNDIDFLLFKNRKILLLHCVFYFLLLATMTYTFRINLTIIMFFPILIYAIFSSLIRFILPNTMQNKKFYIVIGSGLFIILNTIIAYSQALQAYSETAFMAPNTIVIEVIIILLSVTMWFLYHKKSISILCIMYVASIFLFPLNFIYQRYMNVDLFNKHHQGLIQYLNQFADHQPVYFFSTGVQMFPYIDYSKAILASRFEHMMILPGLLIANNTKQTEKDNRFFRQMITQDLEHYKPHLIFINAADRGIGIDTYKLPNNIDYLNYFLQDSHFRDAWAHYHYVTQIQESNEEKILACHIDITSSLPNHLNDEHQEVTYVLAHPKKKWILNYYKEGRKITLKLNKVTGLPELLQKIGDKNTNQLSPIELTNLKKSIMNFCLDNQLSYSFQVYQRDDK